MLDLRDLGYLLDDDKFKQGRILKNFFSGPLERFHLTVEAPIRQGSRNRPKRLDSKAIVLAVGDVITEQSPLLEALTEPTIDDVFSTALPSWVSRLSHLKRLDLFDGSALANESVCELLHSHCPQLDSLTIYSATSEEADKQIATFISGRRPNSLVHFENISNCHIGLETAVALNKHGKSLVVLKIYLTGDKLQALGCLRECTSINTLAIEYSGPADDIKKNDGDLYSEIAEWLRNCIALRDISITNMVSAPDMILPVLLTDAIQLHKLQINSNEGLMYLVRDHQDFHQSIGQKRSLQELSLRADPEGLVGDLLAEVTSSICSLTDLRYLHLTRISDYFSNQHVKAFAQQLVNLEHIYIGGWGITDGVWDTVARLKNLKTLTFSGLTMFTAQGILGFVDQLSNGNQGLLLGVDNADAEAPLTSEEQELVQEALTAKVNGSFAYQLLRGMTNIHSTSASNSFTTLTSLCRSKYAGIRV
jgi:hypothetical protein